MDPNAARSKMIEKANQVLGLVGNRLMEDALTLAETMEISDASTELAEAVHDLDEWLRAGGFLPDVWVQPYGSAHGVDQPGRKQDAGVITFEHVPQPKLADDDRPRVDGTKCNYAWPDVLVGPNVCGLDTGHDGPHA